MFFRSSFVDLLEKQQISNEITRGNQIAPFFNNLYSCQVKAITNRSKTVRNINNRECVDVYR